MTIDINKITFTGHAGDQLIARLDAPENPKTYVLFAHCFSGSKDFSPITRIARALMEEGIALFRFDFTGLGGSQGDFANTNFSSNVQDLVSAANYMRENFKAPSILMGHSFGGTAALVAAHDIPEVKAVATIGSPFDAEHVKYQFECNIDEINKTGAAEVMLAGRKFTIKKQFLDDIANQNMSEYISNLKRALLVMHSPLDYTVNIANAKDIYETAKHPKSFISLDKADHLLMNNPEDAKYVAKVLSAWASRYYQ